ncbi:MAG: hypothetical protein IPI98_02420 [Chitinophagaceae bacterium]|nr:hypothetical protein [Chitinophagaceae bacterium]
MIKTLTLLFSLFSLTAFAQYPGGEQSIGNNNNVVKAKGGFTAGGGIIVKTYTTTTDANATPIKDYPGAIIFTTSDNQYWVRNSAATEWLPIFQNAGNCDLRTGGLVTWSGVGLTYNVTSASFCIGGNGYSFPGGSITLDIADPSYPRFDVIGLDNTGNLIKITGTPSTNPQVPTVNPATQLYLTAVLVNAGATTPNGVSQIVLWDENLDSPSEWTAGTTATANFNNTLSTYHLVKSADVTNGVDGTSIRFNGTPAATNDYNAVRFYVKLKTALSIRQNFIVVLEIDNTSNDVSLPVTLSTAYGFNKNLTGVYQNITIPLSDFGASGNISAFVLKHSIDGLSAPIEYYFDYLTLISGTTIPTGGITNISKKAGTDSIFFFKNGIWQFAFKDSVGTGGGGGTDYVNAGWGVEVDSVGRNYTVKVDSNAIKGLDLGSDTVLVEQPLYVDAGVKDTLKFNADSSGLVKNTFISGGNLYQVVNGDTSLVGTVGGGTSLTWLDVARNSFDVDENRSYLVYDSAINFELYQNPDQSTDFGVSVIDTLNDIYSNIMLGSNGSAGIYATNGSKISNIMTNSDSIFLYSTANHFLNGIHGFSLFDTTARLFNNTLIYETPPNGASTDKIVSWNGSTGVVGVVDRDSLFVFNADSSGLVKDVMRSSDSVYIKINGVWEFAFIDSVGSGGSGGGSVEYVTQGWGVKVDSVGRNYTVGVDSLLLVTPHDLDSAINTIDTSLLVHKAGKEIITGSKEFQDSLVILNPNNATSGTDLFDAPRFKLSSSGWNSALSAPVRQNVYIRHVPVKQTALSDSARAGTIYFSSKTGLQARPTPYDGAYITLDGNWGTTLGIVGGSYMNINTVASSTLSGSNISLGFGALTCTQNDIPTSGNFNLSKIKRTGIVNTTPSYTTTSKFIEYNMEINNTNANTMVVRGFEFNPILTNTTNTDLKAIVTTAGDSYFNTSSGAIGVGVSGTINSSAKLEVASTTKGFLPPRMTGSQAEAISSLAEGLMIYSTDGSGSTITSKGWWGYDGATWVKLN